MDEQPQSDCLGDDGARDVLIYSIVWRSTASLRGRRSGEEPEQSRALVSASTASCFQWRTSCGGCLPIAGKEGRHMA